MRIEIDRDLCDGHGRCYDLANELFESDSAGYPVLQTDLVPAGLYAMAMNAVRNCPADALRLRDDSEVT